VISVGNLTVGGTGKSVVVPFIISLLGQKSGAIVLRGYCGTNEATGHSLLVGDGKICMTSVRCSGDEAYFLAQSTSVRVVVNADKRKALHFLELWMKERGNSITYVVLDDGYQTRRVHKDIDIVLLDARAPFGNGHCLPAGPLRETDLSRADFIIMTHSRSISREDRVAIEQTLSLKCGRLFSKTRLFWGYHHITGVFNHVKKKQARKWVSEKTFHIFAGVGSFDGVLQSAREYGVNIRGTQEFEDHHTYTLNEVLALIRTTQKTLDVLLTTEKDWVKIQMLLRRHKKEHFCDLFFILHVKFSFLSTSQRNRFNKLFSLERLLAKS